MRLAMIAAGLMLSAAMSLPALAGQSGGTMDQGSTGMGTGSSTLDRSSAPNMSWGGGTTGMYHGTSGSNLPRYAGDTPKTSTIGGGQNQGASRGSANR